MTPIRCGTRATTAFLRPAFSRTIAAAALLFATPVLASACDEDAVAARSAEDVAEMIWTRSDVIGFGFVSTVDTPEREQQHIALPVALKGTAGDYDYAPLRIGRLGWIGPGLYRLQARPGEIVFITLVRTDRGWVTPDCRSLELAKDPAAIIRRLAEMSRQRR
jgi:hypothetical protein